MALVHQPSACVNRTLRRQSASNCGTQDRRLTKVLWVTLEGARSCQIVRQSRSSLRWLPRKLAQRPWSLPNFTQRKNQGFDRIIALCVQVLFSFLLLNLVFGYLVESIPTSQTFYVVIIIVAVLFTVLPLFLNLFALNKINSATIGILMYINPIFNFTIAFLVFNERINFLQVIGYTIIILALILFNYQNFRKIQTAVSARRIE